MAVTYTNRKGRTYYLCQATTKLGKPRYFFATDPKGDLVQELLAGFQIRESVNGIVSLSRIQPTLLSEEDIQVVRAALEAHSQAHHYRLDAKAKQITVYEHVGPDLTELGPRLAADLGQPLTQALRQGFQQEENRYGQFTPVLRFILTDQVRHHFKAERMCYLGSTDDWIAIAYDQPIAQLARSLLPTLGTDAFYGLY